MAYKEGEKFTSAAYSQCERRYSLAASAAARSASALCCASCCAGTSSCSSGSATCMGGAPAPGRALQSQVSNRCILCLYKRLDLRTPIQVGVPLGCQLISALRQRPGPGSPIKLVFVAAVQGLHSQGQEAQKHSRCVTGHQVAHALGAFLVLSGPCNASFGWVHQSVLQLKDRQGCCRPWL